MTTTHVRTIPASTGLLWGLTALFALRVFGQALQYWAPIDSLPEFAAFQGSDLPYAVLFSSQILILLLMYRGNWLAGRGRLVWSDSTRYRAKLAGLIYMTGSIVRIGVGMFIPAASAWFSSWIPAIFHVVLAAFVLALAHHASPARPSDEHRTEP
jgi:fatty acid desaturase